MLRHIAWFNEAPVAPSAEGGLVSPDTATCRRCLAPARELEKLGVECSVFGNLHDADPAHVARHLQKLNSDVVIVGKISGPSLLRLARTAKQLGCYLVADFGHESDISEDLQRLAEMADQLVVATPALAASLCEKTGRDAQVIPDCGEEEAAAPAIVAQAWLNSLRKLKSKPPQCANSNVPTET